MFAIDDEEVDARTQVVRPAGDIEFTVAGAFNHHLTSLVQAGKILLIVDLERVGFVDSTALGVLISAQRRARCGGGSVVISGADPTIRKVFEITGLSEVFRLHDNIEQALATQT